MTAVVAWDRIYKHIAEFAEVPFTLFEARLKDHRKQVRARLATSLFEEQALTHDRLLHPRETHNHRAEPVFDLSPAKELLREDVKNKLHSTMSSAELQATRPEYRGFKRSKFKDRILQEVRRQKFLHYLERHRSMKFDDGPGQRQKGAKTPAKKTPAKTTTTCTLVKVDSAIDGLNDAMDES